MQVFYRHTHEKKEIVFAFDCKIFIERQANRWASQAEESDAPTETSNHGDGLLD